MAINKCILLILCQISYIYSFLPKTGKFYITKYINSFCNTVTNVRQVNPSGACWSTDYDNGIKPTAYDEEKLILSIQVYDTSSCYGTDFGTAQIKCDDTDCVKNPNKEDEYLKCTYLSFPSKANFTLTQYIDDECQSQTGIIVLKGDSHCWDLSEKESISPIHFADICELSYHAYNTTTCEGMVSKSSKIICDNSCFASPNGNKEYFRCNYLLSHRIELSYIVSSAIILLLFV